MKSFNFPFIASGMGLFLMLVVMRGSETDGAGVTALPLLTLLVISEFAFFVTAIGAFLGLKRIYAVGIKPVYAIITVLCILLSVRFMLLGIELWPL